MTDDMISISRHDAQVVFDLACGMDSACSGYMETEEVGVMRRLALTLGVDPALCTGSQFVAQFPHKFVPVNDTRTLDTLRQGVPIDTPISTCEAWDIVRYRPETNDEVMARAGYVPPICGAGAHGRMCAKNASDPIHTLTETA